MLQLLFTLVGLALSSPAWAQAAELGHALGGATDTFLQQGILGAVIVVEACVIGLLHWDGRTLRTQLADLAERRTTDVAGLAKETATGLANSSATGAAQADELATISRLLQTTLDMLRLLPGTNDAIIKQLETNAGKMDRVLERLASRGGQ